MISWRLWRALQYPHFSHPLFHRTLASYKRLVSVPIRPSSGGGQPSDTFPFGRPKVIVTQPASSSRNTIFKVLAVLGAGWFCCCSGGVFFMLPVLILLAAAGTVYGLYTAVRIAGNIAQEHDQGRDELLSLTPYGPLGFSWAAITSYLYRNNTFTRIHRWLPVVCVGIALLAIAFVAFIQISVFVNTASVSGAGGSTLQFNRNLQQLIALIYVAGIAAAFYVDFYQSLTAGILIAMITPTYGRNRFETQALTLAAFLGVQIVTYLSAILMGFVVLTRIFQSFGLTGWLGEFGLLALRLGLFIFIREAFITWLWQLVHQRLNIGDGEFDTFAPKRKREEPVL